MLNCRFFFGHRRLCAAVLLCVLLAVLQAGGQEDPDGAPETLTVRELAAQVVENNRQLLMKGLDWEASRWRLRAEEAMFIPVLTASVRRDVNERPNTTEEQTSLFRDLYVRRDYYGSAKIEGVLPLGTTYAYSTDVSQLSNNLNNFSEEYSLFTGVELVQPLLRDFGPAITKARIREAQALAKTKLQEVRSELQQVLSRTEEVYWNLVLAAELKRVRKDSVEIARALLEDSRERLETGRMSQVGVYEAETGVLFRRNQLNTASQQHVEAVAELANRLARSSAELNEDLLPATVPKVAAELPTAESVVESALTANPDYLAGKKRLAGSEIAVEVARNEMKPRLDLVLSYGLHGLDEGNFGDAWTDVENSTYEKGVVGLEFSMPLGGPVQARRRMKAALARQQQQELSVAHLQRLLRNNIRSLLAQLRSLQEREDIFAQTANYKEKQLKAARDEMAAGHSDVRQILEIEQELVEAREDLIRNRVHFRKVWLGLKTLEGTLLEERGVQLDVYLAKVSDEP